MRNTYAGICYRCGEQCAAGKGHFERVSRIHVKKWGVRLTSKWLTQHAACAIEYRATDQHYIFHNEAAKHAAHIATGTAPGNREE